MKSYPEAFTVELHDFETKYLHYLRDIANEIRIQTGYAELSYYVTEENNSNWVFICSLSAYGLGRGTVTFTLSEDGLFIEADKYVRVELDNVEAAAEQVLYYIDADKARIDKMEAFEDDCDEGGEA